MDAGTLGIAVVVIIGMLWWATVRLLEIRDDDRSTQAWLDEQQGDPR
jgi:hypothetical protein